MYFSKTQENAERTIKKSQKYKTKLENKAA